MYNIHVMSTSTFLNWYLYEKLRGVRLNYVVVVVQLFIRLIQFVPDVIM